MPMQEYPLNRLRDGHRHAEQEFAWFGQLFAIESAQHSRRVHAPLIVPFERLRFRARRELAGLVGVSSAPSTPWGVPATKGLLIAPGPKSPRTTKINSHPTSPTHISPFPPHISPP